MTSQTITIQPGDSITIVAAPCPVAQKKLYFSYYGGMQDEIFDYENMVFATTWGHNQTPWIVDAMTRAKAHGIVAAMVSIDYLVYTNAAGGGPKRYMGDAQSTVLLTTFFDTLKSSGLLDMVKAAYPMDEPDLYGIPASDIEAANANIRRVASQYPELSDLKLCVTYSGNRNWPALHSYDWVGIDHYEDSSFILISQYPQLIEQLLPNQRLTVVPGGADPWRTPVEPFYEYAQQEPRVVLIMPFIFLDNYGNSGQLGIKSNGMAPSYNAVATQIRSAD